MLILGRKTFIFYVVNLCFILGLLLYIYLIGGRPLGLSWLLILAVPPLLTKPVVKLGNGRLRVTRLLPLPRNTNVALTDILKVVIDTAVMPKLELHMANGKVITHHVDSLSIDPTKLAIALRDAGVVVEGVKEIIPFKHT